MLRPISTNRLIRRSLDNLVTHNLFLSVCLVDKGVKSAVYEVHVEFEVALLL